MSEQKKGDKKFKQAKDHITISLFNWSKDYASAASTFEEAYKIYSKSGLHEKSIKTLNQLVVCNEKMVDCWAIAKNYEAILDIYMSNYPTIDYETLKITATKAFVNYRMAESLDKGLQMIGKVTKFLIKRNEVKEGLELLHEAYQISLEDEKSFKQKETFNLMIEIYLDNDLLEEAIKLYYENIKVKLGADCQQDGLIIIILLIIQGELKRAQNEMYEIGNMIPTFLTSNECQSADNLIKHYNNGEVQRFKKETTKAAVTTLFPIIIIRKLRAVVVPSKEVLEKGTSEEKKQFMEKNFY